ncbi:phosphoribosyltransferase family protein, partial [Klebsiella pneumoniae]
VLGTGVSSRRAIIVDDEIATGATMIEMMNVLRENGTTEFCLACTHGLFTGYAIEHLNAQEDIGEIVCTDTVYAPHAEEGLARL